MDRFMQLVVLIATIAASCYSHSLPRHEPEIPEIAEESFEYPTAYIEKLVDALRPEELLKFRSIIEMQHREGERPSETGCSWYSHNGTTELVKDGNGTEYFIVDVTNLTSIPMQKCDYKKGYQCRKDNDYNKSSTRVNCCVGEMRKKQLNVVSVEDYRRYTKNNDYKSEIIMLDVYLKTGCKCEGDTQDATKLKEGKKMDLKKKLKYKEDICLRLASQ